MDSRIHYEMSQEGSLYIQSRVVNNKNKSINRSSHLPLVFLGVGPSPWPCPLLALLAVASTLPVRRIPSTRAPFPRAPSWRDRATKGPPGSPSVPWGTRRRTVRRDTRPLPAPCLRHGRTRLTIALLTGSPALVAFLFRWSKAKTVWACSTCRNNK